MKVAKGHLAMENPILSRIDTDKGTKWKDIQYKGCTFTPNEGCKGSSCNNGESHPLQDRHFQTKEQSWRDIQCKGCTFTLNVLQLHMCAKNICISDGATYLHILH